MILSWRHRTAGVLKAGYSSQILAVPIRPSHRLGWRHGHSIGGSVVGCVISRNELEVCDIDRGTSGLPNESLCDSLACEARLLTAGLEAIASEEGSMPPRPDMEELRFPGRPPPKEVEATLDDDDIEGGDGMPDELR